MKINRDKFSASVLLLVAALFVGNWAWSAADYGNTAVLSPTDASNASGTMPSWSGSAAPSTIDDAGRAFQGAAAREWEARSFVTSTGTAPAFVVTQTVAPAAYRTGQSYCFTAHAAAVGTDTANFNSLGAKGIKKVVSGTKTATAANDFYTNDKVCTVYDGTDLVWTNKSGTSTAASETASGIVELATTAEAETGTDTARAVTPAGVLAAVAGKQTIWVPAVAMVSRTTNGPSVGTVETTTNKVMIKTLDFDAATPEYAQFAVQMPKNWNEGTLVFQFVWSHAATATNFDVIWAAEAVAFANDDALDTAFGTTQNTTDTGGTTNDIYISPELAALTVAGSPAAEEYVVFQIWRWGSNASDTLAIDARLHGVKIHYTTNAFTDD